MATILGTEHQLVFYPGNGWYVITRTYCTDHTEQYEESLGDFMLAQTSPEPEYPAAAPTPLEAAQQLAVESILSRSMTLVNPDAFRDAGTHPYNPRDVNRLAASTLSRDVENFLDGLGMVLQPSELDALTDYLESRG